MRRVAIAAGDPGYGAALAFLVEGEPDLQHVGSATDVAGLVELIRTHEVDVAAVDLGLPGRGLQGLKAELSDIRPQCVLVVLGAIDTSSVRAAAEGSGATFALKADATALLAALRVGPG